MVQVVPDTAPQLLHSNSSPEVLGEFEDSAKEPLLSHHTTKAAGKWPWMVVALIAVAIAVGAGVGTWRHHKHLSEQLSSTMRCAASKDPIFSKLTPIARRGHRIIAPHVLHNTSLMIHLWQL